MMKRIIRLTESDLARIVRRVIREEQEGVVVISAFLEQGGQIVKNGQVITSNDDTKGYKYNKDNSDPDKSKYVLMFREGEGKALILQCSDESHYSGSYRFMKRGGMSDMWSVDSEEGKGTGTWKYGDRKITLS